MIKCSGVCFSRKMGLKRDLNVEPDFHQLERWRPSPHMGGGLEGGKLDSPAGPPPGVGAAQR